MKETKRFFGILAVVILFSLAGCGGGDMAPDMESLSEGIQNLQNDLQNDFNDPDVETVDTDDLKAMMPSSAAGIPQTDITTNSAGAFGFKVATSVAEYREGNKNIEITITDAGTMKAAVKAANQWMDADFEETSSNGYKRTGTFFGYRGMEEYESGSYGSRAELSILVADRFVVHGKGRNVTMDQVKGAVKDVKLGKLERKG